MALALTARTEDPHATDGAHDTTRHDASTDDTCTLPASKQRGGQVAGGAMAAAATTQDGGRYLAERRHGVTTATAVVLLLCLGHHGSRGAVVAVAVAGAAVAGACSARACGGVEGGSNIAKVWVAQTRVLHEWLPCVGVGRGRPGRSCASCQPPCKQVVLALCVCVWGGDRQQRGQNKNRLCVRGRVTLGDC